MGNSPKIYLASAAQENQLGIGPTIQLASAEGALPTEFLIWPLGRVEFNDSRPALELNQADLAELVARFQARGVDLVIDYEHQTHPEVMPPEEAHVLRPDRKAPAAGWFKLAARSDGLWAVGVEWTPTAAEEVRSKQYRYFSPGYKSSKETGRVIEIMSLGLTNYPATRGLAPLVAKPGGNMDELKKFLAKLKEIFGAKEELTEDAALGLAKAAVEDQDRLIGLAKAGGVDATDRQDAETRLTGLIQTAKARPGDGDGKAVLAKVAEALGLKADADESTVIGTAKAKTDAADRSGDLAARVAALESTGAESAAEALVAKAMEDGKIIADQKDWLLKLAKSDPAQAKAYVEAAPKIVPTGDKTVSTAKTANAHGPSDEAIQIAKQLGVDPAKLAKTGKE